MQQNKRFLIACSIYATAILLLVILQITASLGCFTALSNEALEVVGSLVPQIVIMFGIPFIMLLLSPKLEHQPISLQQVTQAVGWRKLSLKQIALVIVLGLLLYILNIFVASFSGSLLQAFGYQFPVYDEVFHGVGGLIISIILSAVLPGFCEEFLHRGVLLNGMTKQYGLAKAVLLSSVCFGLMHMNAGQFFYATVLGWFFALTALSTGSLWASMIVHFMNNALSTYMGFADELNLWGADLIKFIFANPLCFILTILIAVIGIGEILRYLAKDHFLRNLDNYTVRYLAAQKRFGVNDFDEVKKALPKAIGAMSTWKATFAYIETFQVSQPPKPLAKAIFTSILVLGGIITGLTLIWGTW